MGKQTFTYKDCIERMGGNKNISAILSINYKTIPQNINKWRTDGYMPLRHIVHLYRIDLLTHEEFDQLCDEWFERKK